MHFPAGLKPSGRGQDYVWATLSYADYLEKTRELVASTRLDLKRADPATIIAANSPYELRPEGAIKGGLLLAHGLYDSPFLTRDFAAAMCERGFLVRGVLLPGHGTVPGDLLDVHLRQWQAAVDFAARSLLQEVDTVYLGGFSTGAALTIDYALQHPHIKGLFLFAPALKIKHRLNILLELSPVLSRIIPHAAWIENNRIGYDYAKYDLMASNAALQVRRLCLHLRRALRQRSLNIPHFVVVSADDEVVCSRATQTYFEHNTHPASRMIIYRTNPQRVADHRIIERDSAYSNAGIENFSHQGLMISPTNSHYGQHGDFEQARLEALTAKGFSTEDLRYGAVSNYPTLKRTQLQLTHNPDFDYVKAASVAFLQELGSL